MPANIWAITQTPDGYLWLGSVNGLYRFDGVRVERIAAEKLPSPSIHALAATASGGLWIGYERPVGIISYLHNGKVTNYRISSRKSTSVHAFAVGPDKTVWASTPDSILRFDGKQWINTSGNFGFSFSEGTGGVWSFGVARDGVVWSKNLGGLFYLKPGQSRFERARGYAGGPEGFTNTSDGRLWTTDTQQARLYPMPDLASVPSNGRPSYNLGLVLPKAIEGPILLDRDGTLWCSSVGGGGLRRVRNMLGAMVLDQGADSHGPSVTKNGLSSDLVHTLFEDREGSVWIGTSLGLDRFRPANIVTETLVPAGFRARFLATSSKGVFAYTGWSGTASRAVDGTQALYRIQPGLKPQRYVSNIGRLRGMFTNNLDGSDWLITQKGIQRLVGRSLGKPIVLPDDVEGKSVYSAAYDAKGSLWISTFVNGVFRRSQDKWQRFPLQSAVGATGVLIPDPEGSMWIRYSGGGLFRVKEGKTNDFSHNGLNIGDVTFIQPQGRGFVIGGENGIGSFVNGVFRALRATSVRELSGVTGIADAADGSTWIFTQAGILRADTKSFEDALLHSDPNRLRFELLDSRDGLPGTPYGAVYGSSAAADPSGRIWFTTGNGLVWIDPRNLYHNQLAPNVVVGSLIADAKRYSPRLDLKLPAGTSNIEIEFTALSLAIPERNRFRYKLEGVDSDWIDATNRRQVFYTRLGPGTYNFHVIAANSDGVWNTKGANFTFIIEPTFVQSRPFLVLCGIAIGVMLWLAYRLRVTMLTNRLKSRLEARLSERERIARELHDTLLQGVQGLILRFQAVADRVSPSQEIRPLMDDALDRADAMMVEGRQRVHNLRIPRTYDRLDEKLHDLGEHMAKNTNVAFSLTIEGREYPLHTEVRDEAEAIAAEAIRNAFRHADAQNIEVVVLYQISQFRIRIRDDGKGMPDEIASSGMRDGHFGLKGIRERAARIGARLIIASVPGKGTEILLVVPGNIAGRARRSMRLSDRVRALMRQLPVCRATD